VLSLSAGKLAELCCFFGKAKEILVGPAEKD